MAFTLMLLAILLFGLALVVLSAILLFVQKSKLAGWIVFAVGLFAIVLSGLGFISLVITSSTMG